MGVWAGECDELELWVCPKGKRISVLIRARYYSVRIRFIATKYRQGKGKSLEGSHQDLPVGLQANTLDHAFGSSAAFHFAQIGPG